jgi:hypothetical protein
VVSILNSLSTMLWWRMGEWSYISTFHDLGISWRQVVIPRPSLFSPKERAPRYQFYKRLGGPQSRSGRCGVQRDFLPPPGTEPRSSSLRVRRYTDWAIPSSHCRKRCTFIWRIHFPNNSFHLYFLRLVVGRSELGTDNFFPLFASLLRISLL